MFKKWWQIPNCYITILVYCSGQYAPTVLQIPVWIISATAKK